MEKNRSSFDNFKENAYLLLKEKPTQMKTNDTNEIAKEMYGLIKVLFPICRSITGDGVRKTLKIIQEHIPIKIHEVPSGTKVFDWTIPDEWNIKDAYVMNEKGERIIDFKKSNLHIVSYSIPFEGEVTLKELKKHLCTLPDQPDLIPYVSSFYEKKWGFCLSYNDYKKLNDEKYYVKIDSTLEPGLLRYGELIIKGQTDNEILLSTNICHPSMANNELSGPVVTTFLAKQLLARKEKSRYTYRVLFIPETIGSITYLSLHKDELKKNVVAGYVITCVGDRGLFSYLQTRRENTLVDRVTIHALKHSAKEYKFYDYMERGNDERQYNYPSIDLPVGSLMRSKYREYPEYHTSGDNLEFVTSEALEESLNMYNRCLEIIEKNHSYRVTAFCEPQLNKYELYPDRGTQKPAQSVFRLLNILNYCDSEHDLLWIAERLNCPAWELFNDIEVLLKNKLIERISY